MVLKNLTMWENNKRCLRQATDQPQRFCFHKCHACVWIDDVTNSIVLSSTNMFYKCPSRLGKLIVEIRKLQDTSSNMNKPNINLLLTKCLRNVKVNLTSVGTSHKSSHAIKWFNQIGWIWFQQVFTHDNAGSRCLLSPVLSSLSSYFSRLILWISFIIYGT
jgi:hypothetical protein